MQFIIILVLCALAVQNIAADNCPNGKEIAVWGISEQGKIDIVNEHNKYRQMIMNGTVPNQPRGKNLKMMSFDEDLAQKGRLVSETCKMDHVIPTDERWPYIGQNLYISWDTVPSGQDWAAAAKAWYDEHEDFVYPDKSNGVTGHYFQLVSGLSELLGCDFISYQDSRYSDFPYAKLYTCNYGPQGYYVGDPPYELA